MLSQVLQSFSMRSNSPVESNESNGAQMSVINSIMSFLPDNRPIMSLQIVEDFTRCPKNFVPIYRTYDQDQDADLWRDFNILFGRQTTRYLCFSKSEGFPEYVVETLKVISEKVQPPKEFSLLSRTADTEQKAWRKRQIAYKLSKRGTVTHAVTDIILCSKLKIAPDGFKLAGDINGVLVCYKTNAIPVRLPPAVPIGNAPLPNSPQTTNCITSEVELALNRLNLNNGQRNSRGALQATTAVGGDHDHDYEEIAPSYRINFPQRPAPPKPAGIERLTSRSSGYSNAGGSYNDMEGVKFEVNVAIKRSTALNLPKLPNLTEDRLKHPDYDFQLERQILCIMKSSASKNPFFQ